MNSLPASKHGSNVSYRLTNIVKAEQEDLIFENPVIKEHTKLDQPLNNIILQKRDENQINQGGELKVGEMKKKDFSSKLAHILKSANNDINLKDDIFVGFFLKTSVKILLFLVTMFYIVFALGKFGGLFLIGNWLFKYEEEKNNLINSNDLNPQQLYAVKVLAILVSCFFFYPCANSIIKNRLIYKLSRQIYSKMVNPLINSDNQLVQRGCIHHDQKPRPRHLQQQSRVSDRQNRQKILRAAKRLSPAHSFSSRVRGFPRRVHLPLPHQRPNIIVLLRKLSSQTDEVRYLRILRNGKFPDLQIHLNAQGHHKRDASYQSWQVWVLLPSQIVCDFGTAVIGPNILGWGEVQVKAEKRACWAFGNSADLGLHVLQDLSDQGQGRRSRHLGATPVQFLPCCCFVFTASEHCSR